jgi:hypothetical protein
VPPSTAKPDTPATSTINYDTLIWSITAGAGGVIFLMFLFGVGASSKVRSQAKRYRRKFSRYDDVDNDE